MNLRKLIAPVFAAALAAALPAAAHAQEAPRADVYTGYSRIQTAS